VVNHFQEARILIHSLRCHYKEKSREIMSEREPLPEDPHSWRCHTTPVRLMEAPSRVVGAFVHLEVWLMMAR
jgi:hypothetical protein